MVDQSMDIQTEYLLYSNAIRSVCADSCVADVTSFLCISILKYDLEQLST